MDVLTKMGVAKIFSSIFTFFYTFLFVNIAHSIFNSLNYMFHKLTCL